MNAWTRSPRLPASLRHWLDILHSALCRWSAPFLRLWDGDTRRPQVRRRERVRPALESLEDRRLLSSTPAVPAPPINLDGLIASTTVSVNGGPQSQLDNALIQLHANAPMAAELESQWADWDRGLQQFVSYEFAALSNSPLGQAIERVDQWMSQMLGAAHDWYGTMLNDLTGQPSSPPPPSNTSAASQASGDPIPASTTGTATHPVFSASNGSGRVGSGSGSGSSVSSRSDGRSATDKQTAAGNGRAGFGSGSGTSRSATGMPAVKAYTSFGSGSGYGSGSGSGSGLPTVYLNQGAYMVIESSVNAELEVDLSSPSSQTVTVQYSTFYEGQFGPPATPGIDYTNVSGPLTFAPGQTVQFIHVPILDDGPDDESDSVVSFGVYLSNPSGAYLNYGMGSQAGVNIYEGSGSGSGAPVANDDAYTLTHDTTFSVNAANGVLANDTDPNNLPLSAVLVSQPSDGTLQFNSDGSFTYTPNAGYAGTDSFTYYASDGQQSSNIATVTLTVLATVSGEVWLDSNQNGILDGSETGMPGITVNLDEPNGYQLSSTTTDANGNYQLTIDPSWGSQFQIQVDIPDGDAATIPFAGSTPTVFSSIDDAGYSNTFNFPANGAVTNLDAGLATAPGPLASISGEVWLDGNDNGILDSGEAGLQAISVLLLDSQHNIVNSTSTDANGAYSFLGVTPNTPYTVQFADPNGYVFSPQNVGPPATSSSADVNGYTAPITLSPSQNDTTVNAGLYGSAPIIYQTNVSMTAENDSYTNIDFTADGYDPGGEPLTPMIVAVPSVGSLVYNPSTGLYDYTAPSNYTGVDNFEFRLSNGHGVSDLVQVQVLAYNGILQPGPYDNFPDLDTALFDGGQPSQSSIKQGDLNDCWFVAAAAGLAQRNPNQIVNMIVYNASTDQYQVTFPGQAPVTIAGFGHDPNGYSISNGDWLPVLEKAYGQMIYNQKWAVWGNTPYNYIDRGNTRNTGIEALTGHNTATHTFRFTRDSTTRTYLNSAVTGNKLVVAGTGGSPLSAAELKAIGLVPHHSYTVVTYNGRTDQVQLYNPWGKNRVFNNGTDPNFWLGKNDPDNPAPATLPSGGNGYFWMSLSEFTKVFGGIAYER